MATIGGQSTPALKPASLKPASLNQTISGQYARFNVFQLVRLLQQKPGAPLGDAPFGKMPKALSPPTARRWQSTTGTAAGG